MINYHLYDKSGSPSVYNLLLNLPMLECDPEKRKASLTAMQTITVKISIEDKPILTYTKRGAVYDR